MSLEYQTDSEEECITAQKNKPKFSLFGTDSEDEFVAIKHQENPELEEETEEESSTCQWCGQVLPRATFSMHVAACRDECELEANLSANEVSDHSDEPALHSGDEGYFLREKVEKILTVPEIVLEGLEEGDKLPLEVKEMGGEKGRGVFATTAIKAKTFLCEYKTHRTYPPKMASKYEQEYKANGEGSYILTCPSNPRMCFDATRRPIQIGRFINHAPGKMANCRPHRPLMVRGKYRVGFISTKPIKAGEEITYDYNVRDQEWMRSKQSREDTRKRTGSSIEPPRSKRPALGKGKAQRQPGKRRYKHCPIEGCTALPLMKLSNHLAQFHGITGEERQAQLKKARVARVQKKVHAVKSTTRTTGQLGTLDALWWQAGGEGQSHTLDLDPTPPHSPSPSPPPAPAPRPLGRTLSFNRYPLSESFLAGFVAHLQTSSGGKKSEALAKEMAVDVAKFLHFAGPQALDPHLLLKRKAIANYNEKLEEVGIQASGRQSKLRRISAAIDFLLNEEEDAEELQSLLIKAEQVQKMINVMKISMSTERTKQEVQRDDSFTVPSLEPVAAFLKSGTLTASSSLLNKEVKEGKTVSRGRMMTEMLTLMGRMAYSNSQRPGPVINLTMREYAARVSEDSEQGHVITVISAGKHKTAAKGAAVLRLEPTISHQLDEWVSNIRPAMQVPETCDLVFATSEGKPIQKFSQKMQSIGRRLGYSLPKLTNVRKAVVTKAARHGEKERQALAEQMGHSVATAKRFYERESRLDRIKKGYDVQAKILHSEGTTAPAPEKSHRKKYTEDQEDMLETYFKQAIEMKKPPVTAEAAEFLECHKSSFTDRSTKDIIDKVRSFIRRNKD